MAETDAAGSARRNGDPARYRRLGLRVSEYWLDQSDGPWSDCDVALLIQYSKVPLGAWFRRFDTLVVELTRSEQELRDGLNRDTRYKINRASGRDGVELQSLSPSIDVGREFSGFYDRFAAEKGLPRIEGAAFTARLMAGQLQFSRANWQGQTIVWHVHVRAGWSASLLYSASLFRTMDDKEAQAVVGRANRALHWFDMLDSKSAGVRCYDFGGWYDGTEDEGLLQINRFKEGFGGVRVEQYRAMVGVSTVGKAAVHARRLMSAIRR